MKLGLKVVLGVLGIVVFLGILAGLDAATHRSEKLADFAADATAAQDPTEAPAAKRARLQARRTAYRDWYLRIVNQIALTRAAGDVAGDFVQNGKPVAASSILKSGMTTADNAIAAAQDDPPEDWSQATNDFRSAAFALKDGVEGFRKSLDSQEPSSYSDAEEKINDSASAFREGLQIARQHYVDIGGKWSDLPDGDSIEKGAVALLRTQE